ncbi:MAG: HisA/HisF-related TIM barrel protein, partial [Bacteroidota bacterium]
LYIKEGKTATFRPGDYENLDFLNLDPYKLIEKLSDSHIERIYLVDLDASQPNENTNKGLIGSLANTTIPDLMVGGGIRDMDYLKSLQYAGVDYFVVGTSAAVNLAFLEEICEAEHIKNERITIALDMIDGHLTRYGFSEDTDSPALHEIIKRGVELGLNRFLITDIDSEHPERSPDLDFFSELTNTYPEATFIVSGHIHSFEDIDNLKAVGIKEVVIGDLIYKEPGIIEEVAKYNKEDEE